MPHPKEHVIAQVLVFQFTCDIVPGKVLKNKFHVVLFAGAPSPDVSFLRQYFAENPILDLKTFVQKQGETYYEGAPTRQTLGDVDLVVLAGWPLASTVSAPGNVVRCLCRTDRMECAGL